MDPATTDVGETTDSVVGYRPLLVGTLFSPLDEPTIAAVRALHDERIRPLVHSS